MIIIPFGDHCATAIALKEIGKRQKSFPYDWCVHKEQMYKTNIYTLIENTINLFNNDLDTIVNGFLGDYHLNKNINTHNDIWFPHDIGDINSIYERYKRRFERLKEAIKNEKCHFISAIRLHCIDIVKINLFYDFLKSLNKSNKLTIISGINESDKFKKTDIRYNYIYYEYKDDFSYDEIFRSKVKDILKQI